MKEIWYEHEPSLAQSWETADDDIRDFVLSIVDRVEADVERVDLAGAYLHGSLAMGSFHRGKSDLDLLFVVNAALAPDERRRVATTMCDASDHRPLVGDLESSVVLRTEVALFHHPLPYEVHYGENLKAKIRDGSLDYTLAHRDPDLAAHCAVVRARGVCLRGAPVADIFGEVPLEAFRESILDDLKWIVDNDHLLETPVYGVLNCCRVLELQATGWAQIISKEEGAQWALEHLPGEYQSIVAQALACYSSAEPVQPELRRTDGHDWHAASLRQFRDYVAASIDASP